MHEVNDVRQRLIDSAVMSAPAVDAHLAKWRAEMSSGSGVDFLQWLVDRKLVSEFQRDAILAGHAVPSFQIGPYRVYEMVAAGELGNIFRAVHEQHRQPVSLKILPGAAEDAETLARIRRELRVAVETHHPNVVRCFEVGHFGSTYYIVLEDLAGETLEARLKRKGYLSLDETCRIGRDIAGALQHLHQNKIVHRDIRPSNIWLTNEGTAKLMGFGQALDAFAAIDVEEGQTASPVKILDDYTYASPEQARDPDTADHRTDIFSLGATLYDCLAGEPPFVEQHPIRQVVRLFCDDPSPLSALNGNVPESFDETMASLLAKKPEDRFQKAKHIVFALDQFIPTDGDIPAKGVEVSPLYLDYVLSKQTPENATDEGDGEEISPETVNLLVWMSTLKAVPDERDRGSRTSRSGNGS